MKQGDTQTPFNRVAFNRVALLTCTLIVD